LLPNDIGGKEALDVFDFPIGQAEPLAFLSPPCISECSPGAAAFLKYNNIFCLFFSLSRLFKSNRKFFFKSVDQNNFDKPHLNTSGRSGYYLAAL
jgi:hypothetical protein